MEEQYGEILYPVSPQMKEQLIERVRNEYKQTKKTVRLGAYIFLGVLGFAVIFITILDGVTSASEFLKTIGPAILIFLVGLGIVMSIIFIYVNYSMSATIREIEKNDWFYYATNYLYSHSVSSDNAGNRGDFVEFPENSIICKKCSPSRKAKKGGYYYRVSEAAVKEGNPVYVFLSGKNYLIYSARQFS